MSEVRYTYTWTANETPAVISQKVTLTNKTAITLNFFFKVDSPFNLSVWENVLTPGESFVLIIGFDPAYRDDKESCVIEKLLSILYRGHRQNDSLKLTGETVFPNLKFESTKIDFGCILNETEKRVKCKMTNYSKVVVNCQWLFADNDNTNKKDKSARKGSLASVAVIPPNQIFDIRPIRSILNPGER